MPSTDHNGHVNCSLMNHNFNLMVHFQVLPFRTRSVMSIYSQPMALLSLLPVMQISKN
ncbi:hypothetical protein Hanom_Chr16g01424831 [Helianthus anomalus]